MIKCHFGANKMSRQPFLQASRASPAQNLRGLRVELFQKLFKGYILVFVIKSTQVVDRYLSFVREINLKKKHSVLLSQYLYCAL